MDSLVPLDMEFSPSKRKQKIYKQRYLKKWEKDWRFQGWLCQCEGDTEFAYCNICHTRILARVASLIAHYNSNKHKKKMKMHGFEWDGDEEFAKKRKARIATKTDSTVIEYQEPPIFQDNGNDWDFLVSNPQFNDTPDLITAEINEPKHFMEPPPKPSKIQIISGEKVGIKQYKFVTGKPDGIREGSLTFEINDDDFSIYGKHVANELRLIKDDIAQQTAKMKINTILFEARTGAYRTEQHVEPPSIVSHPSHEQPFQFMVCTQ